VGVLFIYPNYENPHYEGSLCGFSHKGAYHCTSSRDRRIHLRIKKPNVHPHNQTPSTTINQKTDVIQIQQPQKGFEDSQMFPEFQDMDDFDTVIG